MILRRSWWGISAVTVAAALATAGTNMAAALGQLRSEATSEADRAILAGVELRKQGRDDEALAQFQRAHELVPSPRAKAQIGLAEQATGRWVGAEVHLEGALAQTGDAWIAKHRVVLEEALEVTRGHLGTVAIRGEPAGAAVDVDGRVVGTLPLGDTRVVTGEVVVTVSAPGHVSVTRKLTVPPGGRRAEIFTLKRATEPAMDVASVAPTSLEAPPPFLAAQPSSPPSPERWKRIAAWSTAGVGVAALVGGVAFHLLSRGNLDSFNDETKGCGIDDKNQVIGGALCAEWYRSWERNRSRAIVGYVAGGAFAVTSTVFFMLSRSSVADDRNREAGLSCLPTGPAAAACTLRF